MVRFGLITYRRSIVDRDEAAATGMARTDASSARTAPGGWLAYGMATDDIARWQNGSGRSA